MSKEMEKNLREWDEFVTDEDEWDEESLFGCGGRYGAEKMIRIVEKYIPDLPEVENLNKC